MATTKSPSANVVGSHGQQLYRYLQQVWDAQGVPMTRWCRDNDIPDPTVLRWRDGNTEPQISAMERVAVALGRPLLDVLVAAGYVPAERDGNIDARTAIQNDPSLSAAARAALLSVLDGFARLPDQRDARSAIRNDPSLSDVAKEALLRIADSFDLVESGGASTVRVNSQRRRRKSA